MEFIVIFPVTFSLFFDSLWKMDDVSGTWACVCACTRVHVCVYIYVCIFGPWEGGN